MKKLVLFFAAAAFAVTFAACGNKAAQTNEDATPVVDEVEVVDENAPAADEVVVDAPAEDAPAAE